MKQILLPVVLFFFFIASTAQSPQFKQWDKRFGGYGAESITSLQQTTDGGYILGGWSNSDSSGDKSQNHWSAGITVSSDYWVIKINSLGIKQWDKRFGGTGEDELYALQQTSDGGYILGGYSSSGISGDKTQTCWDGVINGRDYWIVKIDSVGNKQWDKRYGGIAVDELYALKQTTDGGYILGGYSWSDSTGDKTERTRGNHDYWIVKIDTVGNKQWDKRFGGNASDDLYALQQTKDGGYILGGISFSDSTGDKTQRKWGGNDYWIVKTDSFGVKQWDKRYGGLSDDLLYSIALTSDGGYILGGLSGSDSSGDKTQPSWGSEDFWLVKIDSIGTKQWDKRFGGTSPQGQDEFGNVSQTADGGYLLAGTSFSDSSGDKSENNPVLGPEQTWIVKTDSLGHKQWDKTIFNMDPALISNESGYAIQTKEGCYVIANSTSAGIGGYKTQLKWGSSDYWILKFCDTFQCNLSSPTVQASQTIFCSGDSVQVCATGSSGMYLWSTGDTSSCIYANHAGNYYVTVSDANSCSAVSNHLPISTFPLQQVSLTIKGDTLIVNNAVAYQWYFNDTPLVGTNVATYVATQTGHYTVEITDSNGCHTFSNPVTVTVSGIALVNNKQSTFSIFPNPASNYVTLNIDETMLGSTATVYDITGKKMAAFQLKTLNSKLSTENFASGLYFVTIENEKGRSTKKLMIENQ